MFAHDGMSRFTVGDSSPKPEHSDPGQMCLNLCVLLLAEEGGGLSVLLTPCLALCVARDSKGWDCRVPFKQRQYIKNNHKAQLLLELGSCIFSQSWPLWRCESALGPLASACPLTIRGLHFGLPQKLWGFHSACGFHLRGNRRHFEEIMTSWPEDNTVVAAVFFPLLLFFSLCLFVYFWLEQVSWHFSLCWENSLFARSKEEGRKQVSDRSEGMFVCASLSGGTASVGSH